MAGRRSAKRFCTTTLTASAHALLSVSVSGFKFRFRVSGSEQQTWRASCLRLPHWWGKACSSIRKHDHFTPTREIKRQVRALARKHPEGWRLQGNVSPTTTNYLTYRIGLDDLLVDRQSACVATCGFISMNFTCFRISGFEFVYKFMNLVSIKITTRLL